jgi:hypothetical protein
MSDLDLWEKDPQSFFLENQLCLNEEKVRPAAMKVFRALLRLRPEIVETICIPYFFDIVNRPIGDSWGILGSPDFCAVLSKESAYTIIGASCLELHSKLNICQFSFSDFLHRILLPELQICSLEAAKKSVLRVLKARIAAFIGEWYSMDPLAKPEKITVYSALISLLNDADPVVTLFSLRSLESLIDSDDFSPEVFKECEAIFLDILLKMMNNLTELDLKHKVLDVLTILISKMRDLVNTFWLQNLNYFVGSANCGHAS